MSLTLTDCQGTRPQEFGTISEVVSIHKSMNQQLHTHNVLFKVRSVRSECCSQTVEINAMTLSHFKNHLGPIQLAK
jgi:hypothetical protein